MIRSITAGILGCCLCLTAAAQEGKYPNKPIRFVVAFAAGGGTDILARLISSKMTESLGQPVIIDNRPGAGGTIGNAIVQRAAPDGYTINVVTSSYAVSSAIYKISYHPVNDISPISLIASSPFLLAVNPSFPVNSVRELVAYARTNQGKVNYGSTGQGGIVHLGMELFRSMADVNLEHIPYKGTGPALIALLRGEIQVTLGTMVTTMPHVRTKKLRALGVTTLKRSPVIPDLPTVSEAGVPGYDVAIWYGMWGPKGMSRALVGQLNAEVKRVLALEEIRDKLTGDGLQVQHNTPGEFGDLIKRDVEKYTRIARAANIQVQ